MLELHKLKEGNVSNRARKQIPFLLFLLLSTLCFLFSTSLVGSAYALGRRPGRIPYYLRVAIVEDADSFKLTIRSAYQIRTLETDQLLIEGKSLRERKVFPTSAGIKIGKESFAIYGVRIQPRRDASIYVNNRRFRGSIGIIRTREKKLLVVNYIDIEDYLYGVLPREVSAYWPREALKAQAIAARSFALYQSNLNKKGDYELTATVYSQVYGGRTSEKYRSNRMVNQTQGKILVYKNELFPAYYHADSGGHTEAAREIWDIDIPPLKGVVCSYSKRSPHFFWKRKISLSHIEAELDKQGKRVGRISSITPLARNRSNRITELRISGVEKTISLSAHRFRSYLGPNLIRSTNFTVRITPEREALFSGFGWGHGVGFCQWGAYFMAKEGYTAEEILKYYYPESEIKYFHREEENEGEAAF